MAGQLLKSSVFAFAVGCVLLGVQSSARTQSLGVGVGIAIPLSTYVEDEISSDFRVFPEPGYYPTLRERSNAMGNVVIRLALLLDSPLLFFDSTEIRFEIVEFGWDEALTKHTACEPIKQIDGRFDDATAQYYPVDSAWCLLMAPEGSVSLREDISEAELPALQIFNIGFGGRYHFWRDEDWRLFGTLTAGLVITTFIDPGAKFYFGAQLGSGAGVGYRLGSLVSLEFEARVTGLLTEAPDELQNRLNHDVQTGGFILTTFMEAFAFVDFSFSLRFDLSDL